MMRTQDALYIVVNDDCTQAVSGRWLTRRSEEVWTEYDANSPMGPAGVAIMDYDTALKVADLNYGFIRKYEEG